jgi:hypothetical protein
MQVHFFRDHASGIDEMDMNGRKVLVADDDAAAYRGKHRYERNECCESLIEAALTLLVNPAICGEHRMDARGRGTSKAGRCEERELNDVRARRRFQELLQ